MKVALIFQALENLRQEDHSRFQVRFVYLMLKPLIVMPTFLIKETNMLLEKLD